MTVLAIDVGNTTTSVGVFVRGRLARRFAIPTHPLPSPQKLAQRLERTLRLKKGTVPFFQASQVILCSVVPKMTAILLKAFRLVGAPPVRVVGRDLKVPLKNRYRRPEQVGQDRLVGAYAAWKTYRHPCIVADFGTAVTIDVVTRAGEYLGGVIVPGLEISLDVLASRTALLPRVSLQEPPELLGRDTASSIRAGLIYGYAALCDGLVGQLKRRYASKAVVVATGGAGPLMARYATSLDHVRPHLVLEGAYRLSQL